MPTSGVDMEVCGALFAELMAPGTPCGFLSLSFVGHEPRTVFAGRQSLWEPCPMLTKPLCLWQAPVHGVCTVPLCVLNQESDLPALHSSSRVTGFPGDFQVCLPKAHL